MPVPAPETIRGRFFGEGTRRRAMPLVSRAARAQIRGMFFRKLASRYSLANLKPVETARLRLAPLVPSDAEAVRALTDDPAITGVVDFLPTPFTLQDARRLIGPAKVTKDCFLGARLRSDGALAAVIGLHLRGDHAAEVGYWVGGAARGQGLGTEAVTAAVGLLRERFPHRFIIAQCRPENAASAGLLRKVGFRDTGDAGELPGRRIFTFAPA